MQWPCEAARLLQRAGGGGGIWTEELLRALHPHPPPHNPTVKQWSVFSWIRRSTSVVVHYLYNVQTYAPIHLSCAQRFWTAYLFNALSNIITLQCLNICLFYVYNFNFIDLLRCVNSFIEHSFSLWFSFIYSYLCNNYLILVI